MGREVEIPGINVERVGDRYRVSVGDTSSSTDHMVTVSQQDHEELGGGGTAEELIEASFRFLLDREPKESIMSQFDVSVIRRYFPEYASKISDYL